MKSTIVSSVLFLVLALGCSHTQAKVSKKEKSMVQEVMKDYVLTQSKSDGQLDLIYKGKVLGLKVRSSEKYPDGFHSGVKKNGSLYTSCADFVDARSGEKYDIDFLVKKTQNGFKVVQPIVHSINGKKNPYDLNH